MNIEREIKIKVKNINKIKEVLEKKGAQFIGSEFQKTIRFENKGELKNKGLFLRIRSGSKNTITLKSKLEQESKNIREREEIELEISDLEKMRKIINKLGFNDEMIMEKYRSTYKLDKCEVVIDKLPFGNFVEIEGDEKNIFEIIKKIGLDRKNATNLTYWDLFENYKTKNNLQALGKNIVFDQK